jgi:hypothetical protein
MRRYHEPWTAIHNSDLIPGYTLVRSDEHFDLIPCWQDDALIATDYLGWFRLPKTRIVNGVEREVGAWYENGQYMFDCHSPYYCPDIDLEFRPTANWKHTKILLDRFLEHRKSMPITDGLTVLKHVNAFSTKFYEWSGPTCFYAKFDEMEYWDNTRELLYCNIILSNWDCQIKEREYDQDGRQMHPDDDAKEFYGES